MKTKETKIEKIEKIEKVIEKSTREITQLNDKALVGIVGGAGIEFGGSSSGPDWNEDG